MSRIEQIINEMEEYLDGCKSQTFSNNKRIVVEKDVIDDMLVELRMRTPEEIKKYQKIIANKDEILTEARRQAEETLVEAKRLKDEMVSNSEIMRTAYAEARQLMSETEDKAQNMIDEATVEAAEIRQSAMSYTDSLLAGLQDFLGHSMDSLKSRFNSFFNQMQASYDVVTSNRQELQNQQAGAAEEPQAEEPEAAAPEEA
ncbi:MAG: vacuolar family H+-ATPase subunit H [Lachnospiraceae bacterium]|nr:vacuolar family H+-ATPase subunit H [Lachnospiraceae bacterium]